MSWVKNLWRPPTSKEIGLTKEDTFFTKKVLEYVHKYYYDNIQIRETADDPEYLGERKLWLSQHENREVDKKYNDKSAPLQIYTFGCSWTYGWDLPQEQTFTHLLGDENTSVWNYGAGKTGLDYTVKKVCEVYHENNHSDKDDFLYVITIPHTYRRMYFDEQNIGRRSWKKTTAIQETEYNHYLYFLHHYEILNRLIGRDKIIWGTWDREIPQDKIDIFFDIHDTAGPDHPGIESHRLYSEKIKDILRGNGWYGEEQV
jgi:hypothetical protein